MFADVFSHVGKVSIADLEQNFHAIATTFFLLGISAVYPLNDKPFLISLE